MDQLEKISISQFIWYLVPGLGLIYFIFFPLLVFSSDVSKSFIIGIGPIEIIILGIISGFLLDGLRLYRLRPKYSNIRKIFFKELQNTISTDLDPYFIQSCINDLAKTKNISGLSLHHAIWIMLGHFTILAFIEALFWTIFLFYLIFTKAMTYSFFNINLSKYYAITVCSIFAILFFLVAFRFLHISTQDQKNTNNMFTIFAKQYRDEIRVMLNIK